MSIEAERSSCPYCSTQLQYFYINLTEKMVICTNKECLFPFDTDDVSPYIIKVDSLVNTNGIAGPPPSSPSSSSSESSSSPSSSSSSSLLDDKFLSLKTQSKPTSNLKSTKSKSKSHDHNSSSTEESLTNLLGLSQIKSNGVSNQSKNENSNLSDSESLSNMIELSSTESNNLSANSKSINEGSSGSSLTRSTIDPLNEVVPEDSISSSNNSTITLKTLGVTLKVDQPNKNKLQPNSSQFNGLSTDITENNFSISTSDAVAVALAVEKDLSPLFNMNDFPVSAVEGSSANTTNSTNYTTGNGLLNANATSQVDGSNGLTVEEYSQMLFGQSDIDINFDLDNMLPNFNTMDVNMQGNDANMENMENMDLDEFLGTFDSLESSKISGNDMNLDFDSFMASLSESFAGAEIPNDMSGNNLNLDLNSVLVNTNGVNGIQNDIVNGHLDIYSEMVNGNNNGTDDNHSTLLDLTLGNVNGQNGYHEKNGVNGLVEDEGKNVVVGKTVNVKLIGDKKGGQKKDFETEIHLKS